MAGKGNASDVERAIEDLQVIYQHTFMQEMTAIVFANGQSIEDQNITLESVSLQDMLVYLSKQKVRPGR